MPAPSFKGALCSGHEAFPPRPSTSGSDNVIIENKQALREGDAYASHTEVVDPHRTHSSIVTGGSSKIMVNNKRMARIGDSVGCGSVIAQGAKKVQAG